MFQFARSGFNSPPKPSKRAGRPRRRRRFEVLESRRVLAAAIDLASIEGLVFDDSSGNGFDSGEQIANALLILFRDDGDGVFDPTTGDSQERSATTDATGLYRFEALTAGTYFVQQPAQSVSGLSLQEAVSPPIMISSLDSQGQLITTIDSFNATTQAVSDSTNDGFPVTSSVMANEAIGGERDLLVDKTSVTGVVELRVNDPLLPGVLTFDSVGTGEGDRRVSWDGLDGDATVINDNGLERRSDFRRYRQWDSLGYRCRSQRRNRNDSPLQ